jgi:isoquinoline 1-oxidoreductase alpha subunit
MAFTLSINGTARQADVPEDMPLLWVLRDELDMVGTKFGCGAGLCGACTVHLDGVAVRSCQTPVSAVGQAKITTIEGVGQMPQGAAVQMAWIEVDAPQCGYCQAGQIMSASALLASNPKPTRQQITQAMSGNLCRCASYHRIMEAIELAAKETAHAG